MTEYIKINSLEELHFRLCLQGEEIVWDTLSTIWDPDDDKHIEAITATLDNGYSVEWDDEEACEIAETEFPNSVKLLEGHIGYLSHFYIFIDDNSYGKVYVASPEEDGTKRVFYAPRHP